MTFHRTNFARRCGFSLTEILIVIALIVLMLALALPAFNFITGGRSIDGAMNQISAFLSRARTEAVGLQEIRGVMFYIDPKTERQMMVLVKQTAAQPGIDSPTTDVYLDAEDLDHIPLPKGVAINLTNDAYGATPPVDKYIGLNKYTLTNKDLSIPVGGVILFDGNGKLATLKYGLRMLDGGGVTTSMSKLIDPILPPPSPLPKDYDSTNGLAFPLSSFAFVLFDEGQMKDQSFGTDYATDSPYKPIAYSSDGNEKNEEDWIEQNGTVVTINRYNGTLVKGD